MDPRPIVHVTRHHALENFLSEIRPAYPRVRIQKERAGLGRWQICEIAGAELIPLVWTWEWPEAIGIVTGQVHLRINS